MVRVAQNFHDVHGRVLRAQDLLKVFAYEAEGGGYRVSFLSALFRWGQNRRTSSRTPGMPGSNRCLHELIKDGGQVIDRRLERATDAGLRFGRRRVRGRVDCLDDLRRDVAECQEWLARNGERGPAPKCPSGPLAADLFGRDDIVTAWIELLFAAIPVCIGEIRK